VLLPGEAKPGSQTLEVSSSYRVVPPRVTLGIHAQSRGTLSVTLLAYDGYFPRRVIWQKSAISYAAPEELVLDLTNGSVSLGAKQLGSVELPLPTRRFAFQLDLHCDNGTSHSRMTGHYLPAKGDDVGESYYRGEDYVDYEAQARDEWAEVLRLIDRHHASDPILEVGAATGLVLEQLEKSGRKVTGVDFSSWAVDQATQRLGPDKVFMANVEDDALPALVAARAPFATLLLWAVLEHFHDPYAVLAKLTHHVTPDATLIINTTNSASLSHQLFGHDWEGYFDWTHHGVDKVSVESLRRELPRLGWNIEEMYTHSFWHAGADPDHAVLRETFAYDARFSRLLRSHDLGDFLVCVARRVPPST
jgi:2-polyprenyl-3-methyl-5-hydroxy-6-metoxy-1,4-benzoquinol methylase